MDSASYSESEVDIDETSMVVGEAEGRRTAICYGWLWIYCPNPVLQGPPQVGCKLQFAQEPPMQLSQALDKIENNLIINLELGIPLEEKNKWFVIHFDGCVAFGQELYSCTEPWVGNVMVVSLGSQ